MSDSEPSPAVIAACAAVGGLIFIFIIVKVGLCIHRRRKRKAVPLPPARPLAAIHTLPWSTASANPSASKFNASSPSLSPTTYHSESLMALPKHDPHGVYRQYSGSTLNTTEEMPLRQPPSPVSPSTAPHSPDVQLVPPQPSFFGSSPSSSARSSQLSVSSLAEESDIVSYPPQQHQNMTAFPTSAESDESGAPRPSGSTEIAPLRSDYPTAMRSAHSRRVSAALSVSSMQTNRSMRSTRSVSTVRGPPHKSYSRVEIVLPQPLAPQNDPYAGMSEGMSYSAGMSRQSVCDPWLKIGRDSTVAAPAPNQSARERARRNRAVSSEAQPAPRPRPVRPSLSSESSYATSGYTTSSSPHISRASSTSSYSQSNVLRQKPSLDMSDLPPVPRVPSMYTNSTASSRAPSPKLALSDSITGNGSLRGLASDPNVKGAMLAGSASGSMARPKPAPAPTLENEEAVATLPVQAYAI